jgi:tRNA-dihydrouridine synthase
MEGVTGFPMRLWLHWVSRPESMTTPFLRVSRTQPESLPRLFAPELFELRGVLGYELTPQLLAAEPESFLRAAELLAEYTEAGIELNCGCPCPTCIGRNAGSGILADPATFAETTSALAARLGPRRFAVKMRLGYAADEEFDQLLDAVAALPLSRLSVHGRTRADGYRGRARWHAVETASQRAGAAVWGSGDVGDLRSFEATKATAPSAKGVMIGRGALKNPWVFEELRSGSRVAIEPRTLAQALLAFTLVNELSLRDPARLTAKVAAGRLTSLCGVDPGLWESRVAQLSALVCGVPLVWRRQLTAADLDAHRISLTTLGRLRFLWAQLRGSLPPPFAEAKLARAKSVGQFFEALGRATTVAEESEPGAFEIYAASSAGDEIDSDA